MRLAMLALLVILPAAALAQTGTRKGGVPTQRQENLPFKSEWAKPFPQTGGDFYNDPRSQGSGQPLRPSPYSRCPRNYDAATGACR